MSFFTQILYQLFYFAFVTILVGTLVIAISAALGRNGHQFWN